MEEWEENDWKDSEEFTRVVKHFHALNIAVDKFAQAMTELNVIMKDFHFALILLYKRYPELLENSPEGKALVEASKKLANFDVKNLFK